MGIRPQSSTVTTNIKLSEATNALLGGGIENGDEAIALLNQKTAPKYSRRLSGLQTAVTGTTRLTVGFGTAVFFDNSDPANLNWTEKSFPTEHLFLPSALNNKPRVFLYLSFNGFEFSVSPPDSENLKEKICLGVAHVSNGNHFDRFDAFVVERSPEALSLLLMGGFVNLNSMIPSPYSGTMQFSLNGKFIAAVGRNYFNDPANPHQILPNNHAFIVWDRIAPDGAIIASNESNINFTQYWNGTSTGNVSGNDAMVLYLYWEYPGKHYLVLGTAFYNNLTTALRLWEAEQHETPDFLKGNSLLLAAIIGRADASNVANLSQVVIRGFKLNGR